MASGVSAPALRPAARSRRTGVSVRHIYVRCASRPWAKQARPGVPAGAGPARDWNDLIVAELKDELRKRSLKAYGVKAELVRRLEEADAAEAAAAAGDGSGAAPSSDDDAAADASDGPPEVLFPAGGPMPAFASVTKVQLEEELRRRGAPFTGKNKAALYERLAEVVRGAPPAAEDLSEAEMASWMLERGMMPQGSKADMSAMVEAGRTAESLAGLSARPGGVDRATLLDPAFNPASLTLSQLKDVLRGMNLPTQGRKADLAERVLVALGQKALVSDDYHDASLSEAGSEGAVEAAVRERVAGMGPDECAAELSARGLPTEGSPAQLAERLELVLLVEGTQEATWEEEIEAEVKAMPTPELREAMREVSDESSANMARAAVERALIWHRKNSYRADAAQAAEEADSAYDEESTRPFELLPSLASCTHMLLAERTARVRVAVIAGGPAAGAAESLESACTVLDMLRTRPYPEQAERLAAYLRENKYDGELERVEAAGVSVDAYYIDGRGDAWAVPATALHANSAADLAVKLPSVGERIGDVSALATALKASADVAFPVVPGAAPELHAALAAAGVEYVGPGAAAAGAAANKRVTRERLRERGFPVMQQTHLAASDMDGDALNAEAQQRLDEWAAATGMDVEDGVVVVKPAEGRGAQGVSIERGMADAVAAARALFASGATAEVVIEPKVLGALEFSVCVLQTTGGVVALPPSTVEIVDYGSDIRDADRELVLAGLHAASGYFETTQLLDDQDTASVWAADTHRLMPTNQVRTHTPPRLPANMIQAIRRSAERAFIELGLRDVARLDGWLMVRSDELSRAMVERFVTSQLEPARLPSGPEDETPGLSPVDAATPYMTRGAISEEELEALGPQWHDEEPEDIVYAESHDRYFSESHLEAAAAAEEAAREDAAGTAGAPVDPHRYARGDPDPEIVLVTTPEDAWRREPIELATFEGGTVVFAEANVGGGLAAGGFLFQQAAAVGLSHAAVLRHLVGNALVRARLAPLPPPQPVTTPDPVSAAQGAEVGISGLAALNAYDAAVVGPWPVARQRVYVLAGGDAAARQVGLASAVAAWLRLRQYPDLDVHLWLLAPQYAALRERERRRELLAKRNELLLLGVPEAELPEQYAADAIRRPPLRPVPLEQRMVWAVPHALALRRSCEEVVEACEQLLLTAQTAEHARPPDAADGAELLVQMQWELAAAGVADVGAAFEGLGVPQTSTTDFEGFAYHAQVNGAVVFNAVPGDVGADGTLQAYLSHFGIPFTGSGELASRVCVDKLETAAMLEPLTEHAVYTIPKFQLAVTDLVQLGLEPGLCDAAMEAVREALGVADDAALLIKPTADSASTGVMRLDDADHLRTYVAAVAGEWDAIPPHLVPGDAAELVQMPAGIPMSYIVEPFIASDAVTIVEGPDGAPALRREEVSGFVEVTIGVYGMPGDMRAMAPTLTLKAGDVLTLVDKYETGGGVSLTPPPEHIVPAAAVQAARERAELIADALGLNGTARIDAFMNVEDGALYVLEVNTVPGLTPAAALWRQALAEQPALYPDEFLRMQVLIALSAGAEAEGGEGAGLGGDSLDGFFAGGDADGEDDAFLGDELGWMEGVT